ncbi:MAG: Nif3-like dinuclear metal center hexameric protein [Verrucomicrobiae bacterium]|nr:Nif3-like dinuclear metal center hexameric protein [Verrucomicrobiae bacterium]
MFSKIILYDSIIFMTKSKLSNIVSFCNKLLKIGSFRDYEAAVNGLQLQNNGTVSKIGACVDISYQTAKLAADKQCDLLIVHHGMMWNALQTFTGKRYEMFKLLISNNIAVYSCHLPLDAHPKIGNNAILCKLLQFKNLKPFLSLKGQPIGFKTSTNIPRNLLKQKLEKILGTPPMLVPFGPEICKNIGIVSGGAGEDIKTAADEGVDTYITGEGPHWTFTTAQELEINIFYGGHYTTEQFGVKALAEKVSKKFNLPWEFLPAPSGL